MLSSTTTIQEIGLDGYQVVRSRFFSRLNEPTMTLWNSAIGFNTAAHEALNNCECIQLMVNEKQRCIIIKAVNSTEPEAIVWNKMKSKSARLECASFTRQLYESWGFESDGRFRTCGTIVQCKKEIMLLFNFQHPESWRGQKMVKAHGK